jgi:YfiR/HmsC-like
MRARLTLLGAVCVGMALASGLCGASADDTVEYAVKAAYLTKFIPFVTWPDAPPNAPVVICVAGADPFGGKLEQSAAGAKLGERPMLVKKTPTPDATCQIAFLGTGADAALEALRGKPVMTVTDSSMKAHGVISFLIADNHVRFDIDDALAAQDGLQISSKLLSLAHAVKPRGSAP